MESGEALVSKSQYARLRGCTPAAITHAIKQGRITLTNGKIDPARADSEWARNSRARGDSKPAGVDVPPAAPRDPNYAEARARREDAEASLAEMEVKRTEGNLVERQTVESAVFDAFRALRDRVMAAPRRCAPTVAPLSDLREIEAVIADELRRSFDAFEQHAAEQLASRIAPK